MCFFQVGRASRILPTDFEMIGIFGATVLIILGLSLLGNYCHKWRKVSNEFSQINLPGPEPLPIFGNSLALLKSYKWPMIQYSAWAKEFGPMYKIKIGTQIGIVVNDVESVEDVLIKNGWKFNQRPRGTILSFILGNRGIVTSDGGVWKDHRRFVVRKFGDLRLNTREGQEGVILDAIECSDHIKEEITRTDHEAQPYDPTEELGVGLFKTMWKSFGNTGGSKFGRESILDFLREFPGQMKVAEIGGAWNYSIILQLGWLCWNKPWKLLMGQVRQKAAIKYEIDVAKKRLHDKNMGGGGKEGSLLENYLLELEKVEKAEGKFKSFSEAQLETLLSDIIAAGVDTTHNALRWGLIFLGRNERCGRELRREIRDGLKKRSLAEIRSYSYRGEMPYLCGVILEILRIRPIIHTFCHTSHESVLLTRGESGKKVDKRSGWGGEVVEVPAGAWIMVNLWGVHHDEKVWEKPDEFQPERFLDSRGEINKDIAELCIPFSVGIRNCPGEKLARIELYTYLVAIFSQFEVRIHPDFKDVPLDPRTGVSLAAPSIGFQFRHSPLS